MFWPSHNTDRMFSIRRNWLRWEEDPEQGFRAFLEWCIEVVGFRALGHFWQAWSTLTEGPRMAPTKSQKVPACYTCGPGRVLYYRFFLIGGNPTASAKVRRLLKPLIGIRKWEIIVTLNGGISQHDKLG